MTNFPRTKETLIAAVRNAGSHFFDRSTMRFFASRLCCVVGVDANGHTYFVTSEQNKGYQTERLYTVRKWTGKDTETVGEFQQYGSRGRAVTAAKRAIREVDLQVITVQA